MTQGKWRWIGAALALIAALVARGHAAEESEAALQHRELGLANPPVARYQHSDHPDAQWFERANFGLFIHWGISSVAAENEISWTMLLNPGRNLRPMKPVDYWAQAQDFHPDKYDPDKWLAAAARAGFTYAVLTTRHHDGFALWPSKYGDLNTATYGRGEDLVRPFVEACRRHGLKVGLYFSGGNWWFEREHRSFSLVSDGTAENPHLDIRHEPTTLKERTPEFLERYRQLNANQLEELLTEYGKIDIIWFDSGPSGLTVEQVRQWQPGILINNRTGDLPADYDSSYEGRLPETRPGGWWEACLTAGYSWGYTSAYEKHLHPASYVLPILIKVGSWGGNALVNYAPRADGTMPELYYERMDELAGWMGRHRETIIGCAGGPYPQGGNVPVLTNGRTWYLHALPAWREQTIILAGVPEPRTVRLHPDGPALAYTFDATWLHIRLPAALRTDLPDVVEVTW